MSHKEKSTDKQSVRVIEKCLVVVFKEKKSRKHEEHKNRFSAGNKASLFEEFVTENRECYWNPHLQESINNIKYLGFLQVRSLRQFFFFFFFKAISFSMPCVDQDRSIYLWSVKMRHPQLLFSARDKKDRKTEKKNARKFVGRFLLCVQSARDVYWWFSCQNVITSPAGRIISAPGG